MRTLDGHPARTLLQALDAYEAAIEKFVVSGMDLAVYETASQKLDEVRRMHSDLFPRAAREIVGLLVANSGLLLAICRTGGTPMEHPEVQKQRAEHRHAIARLREVLAVQ